MCLKLGLGENKATEDLKYLWNQTTFLEGCLFWSRSCHGCEVEVVWFAVAWESFFPFYFLWSLWDRSTMTEVKSLSVAMSVSSMEYVPEGQILVITYGKTIAFHSAETWVLNLNFHGWSNGLLVGKNWLYKARITKLSKLALLWCVKKASNTLKHIPKSSSVYIFLIVNSFPTWQARFASIKTCCRNSLVLYSIPGKNSPD